MSKIVTSDSIGGPFQSGTDETNDNSRRRAVKTSKTKRSK